MAGGFDSLGLMPELLRAVDEEGWLLPTDVQDESIPLILGGGDVMVASETGSGKTGAFCLPVIQLVYERLRSRNVSESEVSSSNLSGHVVIALNPSDKDVLLKLSSDGLECTSTADKLWVGGRATHGVKSGSYAFECVIKGSATGISRVGWSTISSKLDLGRDAVGFGYGGTAMKSNNGKFEAYGEKFGPGDVVTCIVDWTSHSITFAKNGVLNGKAFDIPSSMNGSALFPAVAVKGATAQFIFDRSAFQYPSLLTSCAAINEASASELTSFIIKKDEPATDSNSQPSKKRIPLAVIMEPARDLAEQVYDAIVNLSKYIENPDIRVSLLVGGDDFKKQRKDVSLGADIIVGTTGKIVDLVKSKALDFSKIQYFILDEADRLIETDNLDSIMFLYNSCNQEGKGDDRLQVCFFSATLHSPTIGDLANKICYQPTWVDLKGVDSVPETVHHVIYRIHPAKNMSALLNQYSDLQTFTDGIYTGSSVLEDKMSQNIKELKQKALLNIIDKFQMSQVMIFCRTNLDCDNLEQFFNSASGIGGKAAKKFSGKIDTGKENQYSCCVLAGMRSLQERRQSLDAFKDGYVRILICTDVAARGIDIKGLPYVINLTLPDLAENYIHRIGRVGRADFMGLAISIVADNEYNERVWYHNCSSKGKGCANRKLTDQGGCTIWYPESSYLSAIEARLHTTIPELNDDFSLPPEIADKQVEYGEINSDNMKESAASAHIKSLGPTVKELAELEIIAQNSYLYMQTWQKDIMMTE